MKKKKFIIIAIVLLLVFGAMMIMYQINKAKLLAEKQSVSSKGNVQIEQLEDAAQENSEQSPVAESPSQPASESQTTTVEVPLIGTPLSWVVPNTMECEQIQDGFVCIDSTTEMAISARRVSIKEFQPDFTETSILSNEIIQTQAMKILAESQYYKASEFNFTDVGIAGASGLMALGKINMDGIEGSMILICTQSGTDLVVVVGSAAGDRTDELWTLANTVSASKSIWTSWEI